MTHETFLNQTDRYDRDGRVVGRVQEGIETSRGLWPLRFEYEYGQAGQRLSEKVWDGRGELVKETRAGYDERGNRVAEVAAWADGTFDDASFYAFDSNSRRSLGLHYNAPHIINRNRYLYDDRGRLVREILSRNYRYDSAGAPLVTSALFEFGYEVLSDYNEQGHVREKRVTDLTGHLQTRSEFTYDDRGSQIEERVFDSNGKLTERKEYRYEYDQAGNWTKETMMWWKAQGGTPQLFRTQARSREIHYHEPR
ncbi:MAG: hypothetical protein KF814_03835 [Nitrospiraceae bacterium]|nr:hypothetical protein [Nitrospiraceae bacterium]